MSKKFSLIESINTVNLERFEAAVAHRQHELSGQLALEALQRLRAGAEFDHHVGMMTDEHSLRVYTRFAAALTAMLGDPGFSFSRQGMAMLGTEHEALNAIYEASAFDNSDHLLSALALNGGTEREFSKLKFPDDNGQALMKFLTAYCLNSPTGTHFDVLYRSAAQSSLPTYLGMLAHRVVLHPLAHKRREELIGLHGMFAYVRMPDGLLNAMSDAYMYCSYAVRDDKHEAKATFGKLIREMALKHAAPPSELELNARRARVAAQLKSNPDFKPTLLVPIEWFNSYHAMYRCYAPSMKQLRQRFRLVASCKESILDDEAKSLFDDFLWLPEEQVILSDLVHRINELAPDVIYYPSIGMALWWVALAQLRLAPVQFMTLGHPATSMSPAIDYVIAEEDQARQELFGEEVLSIPSGAIRFVARPDQRDAIEQAQAFRAKRTADNVIRVAIPSYVVKLTVPFFQVLQSIRDRVRSQLEADGMKLEFHFFTNTIGVVRYAAKRQIDRWLPGMAFVHGRDTYQGYALKLAACDLHFSTFPFGGTNSLVDSFALGIPVLAKWGPQPHERFDGLMLERLGLRHALCVDSEAAYVDLGARLITDFALRDDLASILAQRDAMAEFVGPAQGQQVDAFVRALDGAFRSHQQPSGRTA